jgi:hypothetical protein
MQQNEQAYWNIWIGVESKFVTRPSFERRVGTARTTMHHTPDLGFRRGQTASAFAGVSLTAGRQFQQFMETDLKSFTISFQGKLFTFVKQMV